MCFLHFNGMQRCLLIPFLCPVPENDTHRRQHFIFIFRGDDDDDKPGCFVWERNYLPRQQWCFLPSSQYMQVVTSLSSRYYKRDLFYFYLCGLLPVCGIGRFRHVLYPVDHQEQHRLQRGDSWRKRRNLHAHLHKRKERKKKQLILVTWDRLALYIYTKQ